MNEKNKKDRWFLGGTCAETTWRDELIPLLDEAGIEYFNPVVDDWTLECQAVEEEEKNRRCNVHLYVLTPEMQGVYSVAEIIHSAHLANTYGTSVDRLIFAVLESPEWTKQQLKSLDATMTLVRNIGRDKCFAGTVSDMDELVELTVYDEMIDDYDSWSGIERPDDYVNDDYEGDDEYSAEPTDENI